MQRNKAFYDGKLELIDDPSPIEGKPWTDPDVLELHLRQHKTLDDVIAALGDPDEPGDEGPPAPADVQQYIDSYGLHQPAPLFLTDGDTELNHRTSLTVTDQYGLRPSSTDDGSSTGTAVRFTPVATGSGIEIQLEVGDHVTGDRSNERRTSAPGMRRAYLRYNRRLAAALGLLDRALGSSDPSERTARVLPDGEHRMHVEYDPAVVPWSDTTDYDHKQAVYELSSLYRPLWATVRAGESATYEDLTPDDDYHFRLDVPQEYTDALRLAPDKKVAYHLGVIDGDLAIMVDTEPDVEALEASKMLGSTAGRVNRKADHIAQVALYPPMPLLDALEIGVDSVKPSVTLVPGPVAAGTEDGSNGWFAIVPGVDE